MNISSFFYVLLIASLPFFSIRSVFESISLPLIIFIAVFIISFLKIVITFKIKSIVKAFDVFIVLYFIIALCSLPFSSESTPYMAIIKTCVYFLFYLSLKSLLASWSHEQIEKLTVAGVVLGTAIFGSLVFYIMITQNLFSNILSNFSYYGTTFEIFTTLFALAGSPKVIRSADIMRNTIGEVFSLYFIFLLVSGARCRVSRYILIPLNFIFTVGMFSRRAFLAVVVTVFALPFSRRNTNIVLVVLLLAFVGFVYFFTSGGTGGRLTTFSDPARFAQYNQVLETFIERPVLGYGFGSKLNGEKYVHNFVLASTYMMGVLGFLVSLPIYLILIFEYINGFVKSSSNKYWCLLIIPLLGLTVGSTVEGMFTPTGWIALALFMNMHNAQHKAHNEIDEV